MNWRSLFLLYSPLGFVELNWNKNCDASPYKKCVHLDVAMIGRRLVGQVFVTNQKQKSGNLHSIFYGSY